MQGGHIRVAIEVHGCRARETVYIGFVQEHAESRGKTCHALGALMQLGALNVFEKRAPGPPCSWVLLWECCHTERRPKSRFPGTLAPTQKRSPARKEGISSIVGKLSESKQSTVCEGTIQLKNLGHVAIRRLGSRAVVCNPGG